MQKNTEFSSQLITFAETGRQVPICAEIDVGLEFKRTARATQKHQGSRWKQCWWTVSWTQRKPGDFLEVQCLGLLASAAGAPVWSLVGDLRPRDQKESDDNNKGKERVRRILRTKIRNCNQ